MRPGAHLVASQQQHSEQCKQLQGTKIILHTMLLGVGGIIYTAQILDLLRKLGIDPQRSTKLGQKLCAPSVQRAYKLTSTRRATGNTYTHFNPGALELRAAKNKPYPL
eukprot:1146838-Pelagomonas_calceolata.AAC.3